MSDTTWHGYPQHPDAHPERPWWRLLLTAIGRTSVRSDGARVSFIRNLSQWKTGNPSFLVTTPTNGGVWQDEAPDLESLMAAYDAAHPLPCPPPMCGQVWTVDGLEVTIVRVVDGVGYALAPSPGGWTWGGYASASLVAVNASAPNAVLVAGPGAPWAPMGETEG